MYFGAGALWGNDHFAQVSLSGRGFI